MIHRILMAMVPVSLGLFASNSLAVVSVYYTPTGGSIPATPNITLASGADVAITDDLSLVEQITIRAGTGETIGAISITGTRTAPLRVLLSASNSFPSEPGEDLGFVDANWQGFGDLGSGFAANISLACYVGRTISGTINVGHIRVLRSSSGTISANVTATGADLADDDRAIGYVFANQITGSLEATEGSIGNIDVTGSILGSIIASNGSLGSISLSSEGHVGSMAGSPITILCRKGIDVISAKTINANITANYSNEGATAVGGEIRRIRTTGTTATSSVDGFAFKGSLHANRIPSGENADAVGIDVYSNASASSSAVALRTDIGADIDILGDCNQRIVLGGEMTGDLSIRGSVLAKIEAWGGFSGEITIGGDLRASLVAGRDNTAVPSTHPEYIQSGQSGYPKRFSSVYGQSIHSLTIDGSFVASPEATNSNSPTYISGVTVSQISARLGTIGTLDITGAWSQSPGQPPSGQIRSTTTTPASVVAANMTNIHVAGDCLAYFGSGMTTLGTAIVFQATWGGTIPTNIHTFAVDGLMAGRFRFGVNAESTIVGKQGCSGSLEILELDPNSVPANKQRFKFWRGMTGSLVFLNNVGVRDNVAFHTDPGASADFCSSVVVPNQTQIATTTAPCVATTGPLGSLGLPWVPYAALGVNAADVGTGAIGLAPFTVNVVESRPDFAQAMIYGNFSEISARQFDRRAGVLTSEYKDVQVFFNGLVYADGVDNSSPPFKLEMIRMLNNTALYHEFDPSQYRVEVVGTATSPSREVRVHGVPTYKVSGGVYRLSLRDSATYPVQCFGVTPNPVAVAPFQFWFYLDGSPDLTTTTGPGEPECVCNCWCGDFNQDGGVDGSDIGPFFEAWSAGDSSADVNGCDGTGDGGVDGADLERFFTCWEAGLSC